MQHYQCTYNSKSSCIVLCCHTSFNVYILQEKFFCFQKNYLEKLFGNLCFQQTSELFLTTFVVSNKYFSDYRVTRRNALQRKRSTPKRSHRQNEPPLDWVMRLLLCTVVQHQSCKSDSVHVHIHVCTVQLAFLLVGTFGFPLTD